MLHWKTRETGGSRPATRGTFLLQVRKVPKRLRPNACACLRQVPSTPQLWAALAKLALSGCEHSSLIPAQTCSAPALATRGMKVRSPNHPLERTSPCAAAGVERLTVESGRQMSEASAEFLPTRLTAVEWRVSGIATGNGGQGAGRVFLHTLLSRNKRVWRRTGSQPRDFDLRFKAIKATTKPADLAPPVREATLPSPISKK